MFKRLSIHFALIFIFAFAQISAVTHEISHVEDFVKHNPTSHSQQDSSNQDRSEKNKSTHSEQCAQCISFAKIAGGLAAQSFEFPITLARFFGSSQLQTQASSQLLSAYAARAPPLTTFI